MPSQGNVSHLPPKDGVQAASFERGVSQHVDRLLHSVHFDASARSREFLRFVVEETLAGRGASLTQALIAAAVFGRKSDFDPVFDPIVRVQAGRLRRSLERYYLLTEDTDALRIELPRGQYAPIFANTHTHGGSEGATITHTALMEVVSERPAIVVHLFTVDASQDEAIAIHVKDMLAMELGRYGELRVIRQRDLSKLDPKRQAEVRFELRGALRRNRNDPLIGAQLIDLVTGQQVWADEFRSGSGDGCVFASAGDVARVIAARVGAEHGAIARLLAGEQANRGDLGACFTAIARCYRFFFSRQLTELVPTIEAQQLLTVRAPEVAIGWTNLARLYLANYSYELSPLLTPMEKTISCAYEGVSLEPASAKARCALASALLVAGELEAAREELQQALQLNADSLAYRETIGWLLALAGEWDRGMALMRETMARNPYCLPHVKQGLWADHLLRDEFEAAYVAALEYRDASFFWRELMITCCLGHLGKQTEAQVSAAELLQAKPQFLERGATLISYYIKAANLREHIVQGLKMAGLIIQ